MKRISIEESPNYRLLDPEKDFRYSMNSAVAFTVLGGEGSYYEDVAYYGEAYRDPTGSSNKTHYVYVLVNPGIPGICKIGFTTTSVSQRCKEINGTTGVIQPWFPVFSFPVGNGAMLEKEVHQYLENRDVRVNPKREGFYISSEEAKRVIMELGEKYLTK